MYSNGTESNLLAWSLQCALYKDEGARRLSDPTVLFANVDIVRRYQLFNISRSKLDAMLPGAPLRVLSLQPRRCRDKVDCLMPAMADCVTTISLAG